MTIADDYGTFSPWLGVAYLGVFSLGTLVSMLIFGGLLGAVFERVTRRGERLIRGLRTLLAFGAIGFGGYLLYGVT